MDQPSATTPAAAPAQPQDDSRPLDAASSPTPPGFGSRGRVRRRARFLRKARELAYRDLGGLVFSLHRFGQRNDELVLAKLSTLSRIDAELRALESSLAERQPVTVLREAGITACPRCAAIHSGEDRFCPSCGLPLSRNVDLPIGAAGVAATPAGDPVTTTMPAATPAADPATTVMPAAAPAPSTPPSPAATPAAPNEPGMPAAAGGATPVSPPPPTAAPVPAPVQPPPASGAARTEPPTQTHATVAPGSRERAPEPPTPASTKADEDNQPTEIIRPPTAGS